MMRHRRNNFTEGRVEETTIFYGLSIRFLQEV